MILATKKIYVREITTRRLKFKDLICTKNKVLNVGFKSFCYANINQTQIWYGELNYYAFDANPPKKHSVFLPKISIN